MHRARPVALAFLLVSTAGASRAAETYDFVGLIPEPTTDADPVEIVESIEAWADYMRVTGVGEFRSRIFTRITDADAFIRQGRAAGKPPCFGVVPNLLAVQKAKEWGLRPLLCPAYGGSIRYRHVVVTLRASPIGTIDALQGKKLAVVKTWAEVPDLLGLLVFGKRVPPGLRFGTVLTTESQRECLIAVLRRQADAALVNGPFFEVAERRNRKVWGDLRVLGELPEEHLPPLVAFEGAPASLVQAVRTHMLNASETAAGRHVLDLFHIEGFQPCDAAAFASVEGALLERLNAP